MPETKEVKGEPTAVSPEDVAALQASLKRIETENAELRGRIEGMAVKPDPKKDEPKDFTRQDLAKAVADGKISQAEAEFVWDKQLKESITREATRTVETMLTARTTEQAVLEQIDTYIAAQPALKEKGSDEFQKVKKEFESMVSLGMPDTRATELAALKAVYGSAERLQKPRKHDRETHEETASGEADTVRINKDGTPSGLSSREKSHYQKLVDRGIYKDWKAVSEELRFSNPTIRKRPR